MTNLPSKPPQRLAATRPSLDASTRSQPSPRSGTSRVPYDHFNPHRGSTEHHASFSQASRMSSISSSQAQTSSASLVSSQAPRHSHQTNDAYATHPRNDSICARIYQDRDDPRYARDRHGARRRSRSPDVPRASEPLHAASHNADTTFEQDRPAPWKDLRIPHKDQNALTSDTAEVSKWSGTGATTAATKRVAVDISKWNRKHAELHASEPGPSTSFGNNPVDPNAPAWSSSTVALSSQKAQSSEPCIQGACISEDAARMSEAELADYDYKDEARIACLLCQRKFKSIDTLHRHNSDSKLHKDNLSNLESCRQGVARKVESISHVSPKPSCAEAQPAIARVANESTTPQIPPPSQAPTYRDRASERRAVFGADTPTKSDNNTKPAKVFQGPGAPVSAPADVPATPQSAPERPIDSSNIGSRLLARMGWSQGEGLGLQRQGRTEIVETKVYKPGVGLGSSAPSDTAAHETDPRIAASRPMGSNVHFTGYLNRAKDRARQRLAEHSLQQQS